MGFNCTVLAFVRSTVRHQYPRPVDGYANDYFAEYMLPEGAHNREQDWTVLFLNRGKPRIDEVRVCVCDWLHEPRFGFVRMEES